MLRWFESRIDPFASKTINQPPSLLSAFYWYFIRPIWPAFALLVFLDFLAALTEVALASFVAILIDLMKVTQSPTTFMGDHAGLVITMGLFVIVAQTALVFGYELVKSQVLSPPFQTRARWQTHRYMLRQSLGFFQNDFAGRIANKLMQTAPAMRDSIVMLSDAAIFVAVQWLSSLVLFWTVDTVLVIPLLLWLAAYGGTLYFFVPRIRVRSTEASEARSLLLGRIVDSYTNILTVKLFAHAEREDTYARAALAEQMGKWQASLRVQTAMELVLYALNGVLIAGASGIAIWLWSQNDVSIGAIAVVTGLVMRIVAMSGWILWVVAGIFENMGVVQEGMETISLPNLVVDRRDSTDLLVHAGEIRFENVSFHYGQQLGLARTGGVIDDLSLTIAPGEKVGLVGRSGAGKSTLVNLLL